MTLLNGRKQRHLPKGREPLEVSCLRDGTLDVCLDTGRVYSVRNGQLIKRRTRLDKDGYTVFDLRREKDSRRGKPNDKDSRGRSRWRTCRKVLVHRLVKIKALAVAMGGDNWRKYVKPLPPGVDVNHIPNEKTGVADRSDNRACMLELQTESANRARREMTDEEWDRINREF